MRFFRSTKPDIGKHRKAFPVNNCHLKYYEDLDFFDLSDDIKKLNKKKDKPLAEITTPYHSIGYFLENKLIRIDQVGTNNIPTETYIIWEKEVVKEAHEYYLGMRWGKKISNRTQLSASWFYTYEDNQVKKVVWIDYEDRKYGNHGEMKVTYDYEYDSKGLLFIRQTTMGTGKQWKEPDVHTSYNREKETFLKSCTITKTPLIAREAKLSDDIIKFTPTDNTSTCNCNKCAKPLSYIATVHLGDKFNVKNIKITQVPVLYCFDCMETQHYNANRLEVQLSNKTAFTTNNFKFARTTDKEELQNAFLKIGGQPAWIQGDEHPQCPSCSKTMKFIIEINTAENLTNGVDTLAFGDSGKLYVFACCDHIATVPQWY